MHFSPKIFVISSYVISCLTYAAEEWQHKVLADLTRLQNISEGTWDHGADPSLLDKKFRFSKTMNADERAFLVKREDIYDNRQRGLALYLSGFKYQEVKAIWSKLEKSTKSTIFQKKFSFPATESDSNPEKSSIELLLNEAKKSAKKDNQK